MYSDTHKDIIFLLQQIFSAPFAFGWSYLSHQSSACSSTLPCLLLRFWFEKKEEAVIACCHCCPYSISKAPPPPPHPPVVSASNGAHQGAFGIRLVYPKQTNKRSEMNQALYTQCTAIKNPLDLPRMFPTSYAQIPWVPTGNCEHPLGNYTVMWGTCYCPVKMNREIEMVSKKSFLLWAKSVSISIFNYLGVLTASYRFWPLWGFIQGFIILHH